MDTKICSAGLLAGCGQSCAFRLGALGLAADCVSEAAAASLLNHTVRAYLHKLLLWVPGKMQAMMPPGNFMHNISLLQEESQIRKADISSRSSCIKTYAQETLIYLPLRCPVLSPMLLSLGLHGRGGDQHLTDQATSSNRCSRVRCNTEHRRMNQPGLVRCKHLMVQSAVEHH